jgi:AbrB family looped-hinge helix DNA binding protein
MPYDIIWFSEDPFFGIHSIFQHVRESFKFLFELLTTVTVSSRFQVVIPEIRSRMKLHPGQKLVVVTKDGVIHLIPLNRLNDARG